MIRMTGMLSTSDNNSVAMAVWFTGICLNMISFMSNIYISVYNYNVSNKLTKDIVIKWGFFINVKNILM